MPHAIVGVLAPIVSFCLAFYATTTIPETPAGASDIRQLRTQADPTCAVIESANYDLVTRTLKVKCRASTGVTLVVRSRNDGSELITAHRSEPGIWEASFDVVDKRDVPGLVEVRGTGDCVAVRKVKTDFFASFRDAGVADDARYSRVETWKAGDAASGRPPRRALEPSAGG